MATRLARPRSILRALLVAGTLITALAGGAAAQSPAASDIAIATVLDDTNWSLRTITTGGSTTPVADGAGATLDFVAGDAGGSAGCNRFSASYTADATTLTFGPIMTTRIACDGPSTALGTSYLGALPTVASYTAAGGTLTLMDASGGAVLTFGSAPMPSVEGSWVVTGFYDGSAAAIPSAGSGLTVAFASDGRVNGSGGCNDFGGPYGVSGNEIFIGPLMSTMSACDATLDTQEQQYLTALQQASTWAIDSGKLKLRDYSDTLWVGADRAGGH